jgi:transketolase
MRTAFINQLIAEARLDDSIFLIVGDLGYSVVEPFAREFPRRFLNAGIAEQNMTGIACGLASEGYNVFTYSIGNFPTLRCMEQIRYDVCYHNSSVKIVSVGGGYSYGPLGVSHHTTEDIGMLRTIPNLTVCAPGDPEEAKQLTSFFCRNKIPGYLRLGKAGEPVVHKSSLIISGNSMIEVLVGSNTVVLSTGGMLSVAHKYIVSEQLTWGLYSVPFIKPMDEASLAQLANKYERIITLEEHQRSCGFGSAILESLNNLVNEKLVKSMPQVVIKAIPDLFIGYAGSQEYLRNQTGLFF